MTTVRRNQGHSALNDVIRADWIKAIELSQDRFDALLYVPKPPEEQTPQSSNYEAGIFEELDSNQDTLEYYLPVPVSVLDCPDETESFMTMNDTDENLGDSEMPLVLRIGHTPIQIGSILEWEEELSDGQVRRCWWYVHSAVGYGTANVGSLYVCIPAANFEAPPNPPVIILNPRTRVVKANELVTYDAGAEPYESVQWYYNDGTSWNKLSDQTSTALTVTALETMNGWAVAAHFTNDDIEEISREAYLYIGNKFIITPAVLNDSCAGVDSTLGSLTPIEISGQTITSFNATSDGVISFNFDAQVSTFNELEFSVEGVDYVAIKDPAATDTFITNDDGRLCTLFSERAGDEIEFPLASTEIIITLSPNDFIAHVDDQIILMGDAINYKSVSWQQKQGEGDWELIEGANTTQLAITASTELDRTQYRIVFENRSTRVYSEPVIIALGDFMMTIGELVVGDSIRYGMDIDEYGEVISTQAGWPTKDIESRDNIKRLDSEFISSSGEYSMQAHSIDGKKWNDYLAITIDYESLVNNDVCSVIAQWNETGVYSQVGNADFHNWLQSHNGQKVIVKITEGPSDYRGSLYIDNGGINNNFYGMHLDGDNYGSIDPKSLFNGVTPLNIMAFVFGRNPSDDVVVTFGDPTGQITLGKTYASIIIDERYAICAPFNELSENGNPQFVQKNNHFSSMLLDELHQTKKAKISIGEYERPIGERFDFVITQDSYYDTSTTNRKYIIGYKSSKSAIEPATILGSEIKYLYINDSIKYGADFKIYADSIQGKHSTIIYNNNPYLLGKEGVRFTDLNEESEYFVDSIRLCDDGMKVPCSVFIADEYILTVKLSSKGILGMSGANDEGNLSPLELEGFTINYFGYRYSNDLAWIQFKSSDAKVFSKIYLEMDGVRFCAEKVSEISFYIDKKDEFKAILEAHKDADITFSMYAPRVVFTEQPHNQEVYEGDDYTFSFDVKEYDAIKWWVRSSSSASWITLDDENSESITRTASSISDGYQYKAWVSFDGSYAYSDIGTVILKTGEKPDFTITPDEIDTDYYGVSVNYASFGMIGEVNPKSDQWIPSGSITLIAARRQASSYNLFLVGNERWNGYENITIKAVAESGEVVVGVSYDGGFDRYEARGGSIQEWYDFIKANIGNEIEVHIKQALTSRDVLPPAKDNIGDSDV
ncbi:hypothetical protein [Photobacterium damselae]|uniref:hypothetical protein n=1 Tax=Photobacterium damselae TaxID=38293 RepID=UPI001F3BB3AE|nr:hypothetical protein [Photobacterium damselae]UKA12867.1 hypothetical protein IHC91_20975 [Photobacterium damselae subsp. damselae]